MFCCPVRVKSLDIGEVGKRDSSDREDYYFDRQEPSSDAEKCVCICESATLESTRFYLPLFRFPPALMLLLATLVTIVGRESGNTTQEIAAAAAAKAAPEPAHATDQGMSGPGGPAAFSYEGDTHCANYDTNGDLLRFCTDHLGEPHGPFPESQMQNWWRQRRFVDGPDLIVKLRTWGNYVKLKVLYPATEENAFVGEPAAPAWAGYRRHGAHPGLHEHNWTRDHGHPKPSTENRVNI